MIFGASGILYHSSIHAQTLPIVTGAAATIGAKVATSGDGVLTKFLGDVVATFIAPIALFVLKLVSLITALSGIILNYVVKYTVVDVAKNYGDIKTIDIAWTTVRDVANMGFIFVLLYASIELILGIGKDTRKLIVSMIIAALLINFSLFFTKVVIDSSNILAITFYNAIVPGGTAGDGGVLNAGLSNALMEPLNLASIFKAPGSLDLSNATNLATIGVMGSIVALIAAFVFFSIALMFVIRYVVLILVLILSPIAFVSGIIPGLDGAAKQWKEALFNQAFFAPVYMLLTWITIIIFQGLPPSTGSFSSALTATGGSASTYTSSTMGILFNFVVVIVFLIATLLISKNMANKAGPAVSKLTGAALGFAGGATLGLAASAGRRTIGGFGAAVASSEGLKKAEAQGGVKGMAARLSLMAGQKTAKQSFDFRGTDLGGTLGAGKAGGKDGYNEMVKQQAKKKEEFAKSLAPSDIVVDRAKQNLEKAKGPSNKAAAQAEVWRLEGNKKTIEENTKKEEENKKKEIAKIREDVVLKETLENEKTLRDLTAKLSVDMQSASGSDKDTARTKLNAAEQQLESAKAKTAEERTRVEEKVKKVEKTSEERVKGIKEGEIKGLGEIRSKARAEAISNPGPVSLDRVFLVGKVKRASLQAAANIRKDKKDAKKLMEEVLKTTGELKEEKPEKESTSSETPPKEAEKKSTS